MSPREKWTIVPTPSFRTWLRDCARGWVGGGEAGLKTALNTFQKKVISFAIEAGEVQTLEHAQKQWRPLVKDKWRKCVESLEIQTKYGGQLVYRREPWGRGGGGKARRSLPQLVGLNRRVCSGKDTKRPFLKPLSSQSNYGHIQGCAKEKHKRFSTVGGRGRWNTLHSKNLAAH